MKKFNLRALEPSSYEQRQKNVFYQKTEFKMRIIHLEPDEVIPECQMSSHVVFLCLEGLVEVMVDGEKTGLGEQQLLAAEPGLFSMKGLARSRLLGIQVKPSGPVESAGSQARG